MMMVWGFIILLTLAVIFLIWLQFNQNDEPRTEQGVPVEEKVAHLEENLKRLWKLCRIWPKMHVQQEVLDQTTTKLQQVELQNAELVSLLTKVVDPRNHPTPLEIF